MQYSKDDIKKLIGQGSLDKAIDILFDVTNKYIRANPNDETIKKINKALILNSAQFQGLNHNANMGTLRTDEKEISRNKITEVILDIVEIVPDSVLQFTENARLAEQEALLEIEQKQRDQKIKKEQVQREQLTKNSEIIVSYATQCGANIAHMKWIELKNEICKKYGNIVENKIADIYDDAIKMIEDNKKLKSAIEKKIPVKAQKFVETNEGEWNHRKWMEFKKQIFTEFSFDDEQKLAELLETEKKKYEDRNNFTDPRDGEKYKIVKIGNQTWLAENLRTTKYNDGTPIPNITDSNKWIQLYNATKEVENQSKIDYDQGK